MIQKTRTRTNLKDIAYALHLYFDGLSSLRNTARALSRFVHKRSHTAAIRDWIQKYKPKKRLLYRKTNVDEFIVDYETQINKVGSSEYIWL